MSTPYWVSPREASLLITGRCNLRCRHCSVTSHGELLEDLPLSSWVTILDELQKNKVIKLTITGGEPLLRPDFTSFIEEVYKRPFRFSVNTNGTLFSPDLLNSLTGFSSRMNEFMISLDGPDESTVDSQRGTGVFSKLVEGVRMLRETDIPFGFYCTITSLNIKKLEQTVEFAGSAGALWIKFNNFVLAGPGLDRSMLPAPGAISEAGEVLHRMQTKYPGFIEGTILDMYHMAGKYLEGSLKETQGSAFACGGGRSKISVFPDGTVTPCDHLPEYRLGNITDTPLQEILTGERMNEFTGFLNRRRSEFAECADCTYLRFCSGGCPVEALGSGEVTGKDRLSCLKLALIKN